MEFMGIAVGILALICALMLLFGRHGTRKLLGWSLGLIVLGAAGLGAAVWVWPMLPPPFNAAAPKLLSDADVGLVVRPATPIEILPALPALELANKPDLAGNIKVTGPDRRTFVFSAGTEEAAIKSYMQAQYGAPRTAARAECWVKEPGPWCDYR
jgi:hypothetical protein